MSIGAGDDAGGLSICSSSGLEVNEYVKPSIVVDFKAALEASALYADAERIRMLMNYANVEHPVDQVAGVEIERIRRTLEAAKLRVMHSSIESVVDLAIKVLVAAEDGFRSKEINSLLEKDAQQIVAAA